MSGWPYKARKWRDRVRAEFLAETGGDFDLRTFTEWLREKPEYGEILQAGRPDTASCKFAV